MRRFSATVLAGFACLAAAPAGAGAADEDSCASTARQLGLSPNDVCQSGGANNVVNVITSGDGSERGRTGLQVALINGDTAKSSNIANALASNCTGCRSAAVAVQAVVVSQGAHNISPGNFAGATTAGCSGCGSYAYAFQATFTIPGPVHISSEGQEKIRALQERFTSEVNSRLSRLERTPDGQCDACAELDDALDPLSDEFIATVKSELVAAGYHVTPAVHKEVKVAFGPSSTGTVSTPAPSGTTTDQTSTPTTDQTSGTSGSDTSGSGTSGTSGTDTSGTSGTDTSGSDTTDTSGTDQTSGSDSGSTDQQSSTSSP